MMIWDAVRRFSGVGKRKGAARTIDPRSRRREILGSFRGRDLRMEQFEDRVLLSITPPAGLQELESFVCPIENYSYLSDSLSLAVYQSSDLSGYEETQLETTYQWVVGVDGTANAPQLAASMGADFVAYAPYLTGATVWEFSEGASWLNVAQALQSAEGVDYFYPLVSSELAATAVPNDTLFADQWHLQNTGQSGGIPGLDCNVVPAWDTVTGSGVVIAIVDDGLEMDHPDLIGNLRADLSYDFNNNDNDPSPEETNASDNHGTSVAGVAGGVGNNGLGVSGTAPDAELAGLRLISGWIDDFMISSALSYLDQDIDIYNNSWGRTSFLIGEGPLSLAAVEAGATNGRGGLGSIYVFAASNDREWGGNANYFDLQNSRQVIAVAAIDHSGRYSYYSNPGAPVLISGYSSSLYSEITTTDRTGEDGYNSTGIADGDSLPDINYTSTFGGTSSAAPLVSGIIALILEANPNLTYRDVQHILVESAEMNDPSDLDWVQNGAGYWVNHNYGFGAADATAAVELALDWENVTEEVSTGSHQIQVHEDIPDSDITGISSTVTLDDSVEKIEWVEVTVDIPHSYPNDLEIILVSPDGTESRLAEPTSLSWYFGGSYEQWTFSSCHHWGESSEGQWTLKVRDLSSGISGRLNTWELNIYGTSESTDPGPGPGPDEATDGPELVSISPNQGGTIQTGTILHVAPSELTLLFNERQVIDPDTLGAIHIVRSGGDDVLGNANDVTIEYGWIGIGDRPNEVVIRFAQTLPDDLYQITIIGDGSGGDVVLMNVYGGIFHGEENVAITFSLDLGAQVVSVVPQPTYRDAGGALQQSRNTIEVYFNDDELKPSSVQNTSFYQLFATQETADPNDDLVVTPDSVVYDPVANKAVLTFADDLANLGLGAGAFRLRIGNEYRPILTAPLSAGVVGDTLAGAADVGTLGSATLGASLIISSAIEPLPYDLQWPGSIEEPGHRETLPNTLLNETHFAENYLAADDRYGTTTVYYGFPSLYAGLPNLITPEQKLRAREIFELYSSYFGVQFIEDTSGSRGLAIVTGDMRVLNPAIDTGVGGTLCLAQDGLVVLDNAEPWEDSYGGTWFQTAMQGIGLLLGLGYTTDLPPVNTMNANADPFDPNLVEGDPDYYAVTAEDVFPGNNDIIHGQFVYRPDGTDVDIYKFTLDEPGTFSAEVTAERLADVSLLDSILTIYDADGNLIARNDDYYSEDSFIELALPAGDYFVAISSTGNVEYDAEVAASGLGGRTQGDYELRLTYRPDRQETGAGVQHMVDVDGTQLDGDADGVPGGVYSFWFNVQSEANTIYVDKTATGPGTRGSIADPYNNIKAALQAAQPGDVVRIVGNRDHAFDAQIAYDVSVDPTAVAVGDFDGNGTMDIVATNKADDSISILFGMGDGTYRPDVVTGTGDQPGAVAVGDLDNDGDLDIIVANQADNTIMLLANNGTGTFSPGQTWFTGISPSAVALGDVNHDGTLDIFVANRGANQVGVLLSKEDGTHADQVTYNVGQLPSALDLGDLNNDGDLDVVVANQGGNSVSILINQGNGTFVEAAQRPTVGASPSDVAIADLDGDGNRDLVVSNSGDNSMSVLLGLGDGRFNAQVTYAAGSTPSSIAVADIDGDGSPDAVVANKGSDSVSVFFNNDDKTGTFAAAKTYAVGDQPVGLSLADMDGDSRPDILTANYGSMAGDGDAVSVLLSRRDQSYLIGIDKYGNVLPDGSKMEIPKGVTVMIDAGAVFKLANANIDVGSSSLQLDRSLGALQVLGTPESSVYFTSFNDKSLGSWQTDQSAADLKPSGAQWGGLVFRNEQDYDEGRTVLENEGIFLNYVNHAEIRYGGGSVSVNGVKSVYNSIHMVEARPTISFNTILNTAGAAMSADPNSFADSRFQGDDYTANYDRVGPDIHGNTLLGNTQNGIFVRIATAAGSVLTKLDVCARFDDTDIVHIIAENLIVRGTPGGPTENSEGVLTARFDARLAIDPGIIVKLDGSRIETEMSAQLLAEGTAAYPIIFTSLADDTYGAGGTFDTGNNGSLVAPEAGDWGGLYFAPVSSGSIDQAYIAYGGGQTRVQGGFADFNAVEIHQANVRLVNSVLANNTGADTEDRVGRPGAVASVIFVRGAQPILVGNVIRDNEVAAISINANSLTAEFVVDPGRSTGLLDAYEEYCDNYGPLVRGNHLSYNATNGMVVRGEVLSIDSVWDDTDIVHVVYDEIVVPNFHTYGGLRLQSAANESLVVKLYGDDAGFTALGTPGDVVDRIGGTLQIVGAVGFPVVLTSLADDSVGAGVDPWGKPQKDTDNAENSPYAGDWRSVRLAEYVNDRNVNVIIEAEAAHGDSDDNDTPIHAQSLGSLAPNEKSSDENLRLGFDVHGFIQGNDSNDADVYEFSARAGTQVWIDVDRTSLGLDSVVELIDAEGNVIASSDNSPSEELNLTQPTGIAYTMDRDIWDTEGDMYTTNVHDAGMRLVLPGTADTLQSYFVRIRSADVDGDGQGDSSGGYQLQIRLRETQEIAGSTVRLSSIRYATDGIELLGLPTSSPLLADTTEIEGSSVSWEGVAATATLILDGNSNDFTITANVPGAALNNVWVGFLNGGTAGNVAQAIYDPAFDNGGTIIKLLYIVIDPNATTAATVVDAINAEGTFTAALTANDGGANTGAGSVGPTGFLLEMTSGGVDPGSSSSAMNDTFETAEHLGNLLDTSYGSIEVSGYLSSNPDTGEYDIDWYSFTLDPEKITDDKVTPDTWGLVFDIDFADGMARPDTVIYVFDSTGALIYVSDNSNVDEDQVDPIVAAGIQDLTRGSAGTADPYIGPVALLDGEGMTYYVAVASKARFSAAFAYSGETGELLQPLLRLESVNSVVRIAEDNVGDLDGDGVGDTNASGVAGSPQYNLFPDPEQTELSLHIDDYHLSDVVMYVCIGSDIYTFNPFTGEYHYDLTAGNAAPHQPDTNTRLAGALGGIRYDDIIMRNDGKLYSFTSLAGSAGNTGRYRQISTGNGSILSDVDDGIVVYVVDPDDAEASIVDEVNPGVTFRAMIDVVEGGVRYTYAIGGSDEAAQLMFKFDQDGNVVTPSEAGATPTSVLPWRQITGATGFITGLDFCNGTLYGVTDQGMMYSIDDFNSTPIDISFVDEGDDGLPPAWTPGGGSNWVLELTVASTIYDLTAAFSAAAPIAFSGLTIGPANVEFRAYAETFFATDNAGNLYAFDEDGTPDPVFMDGLSMIPIGITNPFGVVDPIVGATGIAFSTLDYNLWHVSASRYMDEGHTVTVAPDDTRLLMSDQVDFSSYGYYSYWFGLENSNYYAHPDSNNYLDDNAGVISTYDLPGGAHGVLTTDKFSLAGYEAADHPVLTFDYYLETDGGVGTDIVTDTARVYISNDGANWSLLATNIDTPRDVMSDSDDIAPALMQDGTGGWLQLSVDLSDYVGRDNLRLKFEFSSAGSTNMSDGLGENLYTGAYLRAVAGGELVDGDSLIIMSDGSVFGEPSIFEFDMGYSLAVPNSAGSVILDGETLTITEDLGGTVTFEFVKDGALNDPANLPIFISDADSAFEVANLIAKAFNDYYFLANPDAVLEVATVVDARVYLSRIDVNNAGLAITDPASTDTQNVVRHGAVNVTQGMAPGATELAITLEGNAPGQFNNPDASVLVAVDGALSAKAVAYQFSLAMDTYYGGLAGGTDDGTDINPDILTSVKWNEDLIYVQKHVAFDPGKFSYSNLMMGEEVAAGRAGGNGTQFYHNTQAQDNAYEGWYIDNVTIGFTERGQMVTNAMPDTRFGTLEPEDVVGLITTGYYQLEIRLATEYSYWNPMYSQTFNTRGFDTNDRHSEDITILAPAAGELVHGGTFIVSDGLHAQTFRFIDPNLPFTADPTVIDITFEEGLRADEMAALIVAAINSAADLDVTATSVYYSNAVGSNRVLLNGAAEVDGMDLLVYDEEGQFPTGVVVYDTNGDLIVDVAFTCDEYTGTVTDILYGVVYDVGNLPSAIAMADVNNDGTLDIVTSNAGDHTVSLLLGNSTGTYERQVTFAVGTEPSDVALYDLDADGNVDIVTANKTDGTVTILYGLGDGTFQSPVTLPVGWAPMGIAVGDLNGDGFSDIVVANSRDNTVSVLLGVTNVVYAAPVTYDVGRLPVDVKLGDMNNDGAPDILTANRVEGTLSLLLGDGFGGFADAVDYAVGTEPVALDVADLDLDEDLDVVVVNYSINGGSILLGTGLSERTLSDSPIAIPTGTGPRGIALGDIDEDTFPDIFTADYLAHQSTVLLSSLGYAIPITLSLGNGYLRKIEGDPNEERVQGIVVIESNEILYAAGYGIEFDAGQRDGSPHPGSTAPLVKVNQQRLVPCVMIQNNLIVGAGTSGILFSGDTNQDGTTPLAPAAVPFGRIVNNTIYGGVAPVEELPLGEIVLGPNNNDTAGPITIGFALELYGNTYTEMYVNNNGNITFNAAAWNFDDDGFPQAEAMIAAFWADVDSRATGEVRVSYGTSSRGNPAVQIDWIDVGYFSTHDDKKNTFSLYLEDDPEGDIVMFIYDDMQWTTGDFEGVGGFGGQGAEIGFNSGDGVNYVSIDRPNSLRDLEDLVDPGAYVWRLDPVTGVPFSNSGTGIEVSENASPTILNNIVANLEVGISVDATCSTTVLGANVYHKNLANTIGAIESQTAIVLGPDDILFVDPDDGNFYLASGSHAIDSSIDSLEDRPALKQVRDPLGISPSPILAPDVDLYGQLRADDINAQPPSGVGSNVFKDRGAIDRVDFVAPTATIIDPMDRDSVLDPPGVDRDLAANDVFVVDEDLPVFSIQLSDTTDGIGIDDKSVTPSTVTIYKDGGSVPLVLGKDYYFRYDDATDVITLIAAPGLWKDASRYKIVLDNSTEGIRDVAGNALRPNRIDGTTYFTVSIGYVDFGDAPDPDYPTALASDGARHLLIGNHYLGNGVSGEADARVAYDLETGELLKNASADTMDDGVSFTSSFLVGSTVTLDVNASASGGYLHAWIDLNGDGDFDDADEHVIASEPLAKGWNSLSFALPTVSGYFPRDTFMRFRYIGYDDTAAPIGPTGEVVSGEVEDYQVVLVDSLKDFGDAPNPYPTLLADNGAYHILGGSLYLGSTLADVDDELDGQPSATARGDDNHGLIDATGGTPVVINDENGVRFLDYIVPGTTIDVSVTASGGGGYLNAWIDFNADGDWDDAGEQIATGHLLAAGDNTLSVAIPANAVVGKTFARFRLSTEQFLGVTGGAIDGEVEDYQILVTDSPRDYGDAPLSYFTKKDSQAAVAHLILAGQNNDMLITAVVPGVAMNDVNVVIVNELAYGDEAFVEYDADANELRIDVDPQFTTAATVVAAINSQVGSLFSAALSNMVDQGNDGSGLLPMKGMVAITAGGEDGFGDQAAFHYLTSDLYLGTSVDAELDGQPNAQATGDDNTDTDDEDGVLLPSEFVAGTTKNFDVKVHLGSTATAYLHGWIDFNLDGVFTPDEQILYGNAITAADLNAEDIYSVTVTIPIAAVAGTTIARFRLSTDADLSFSGAAPDGEVEDYQVNVVHGTAVLAGWVFEDRDRDGTFDNSEIGIAGVIVYIDEYTDPMKLGNPQFDWDDLNSNGQFDPGIDRAYEPYVITMADDLTTPGVDETGYYIFDGLAGRPAAYQVRFDAPSLEDYQVIYPDGTVRFPDGSRGNDDHSYTMYLQEGEEFQNVNFGSYPKPTVSVVDVTKYEGHEGFTDVQVTLRLVNSFGAPVEINYWTEDGSATIDNDDYVGKTGTITFDPQSIPAPTWDIHHLTSNASNDYDYGVSGNYVAWEGFDGNDWEIYLSNGTYDEGGVPYVIQLTNNDTDDRFASLYDTGTSVNVVWVGTDGHDDEIYLYNGATNGDGTPTVIRITSNAYADHDPQVSDSLITWWADDGEGDNEIFVLDLAYVDNPRPHIINLTDNALDDRDPVLSGRNIVWTGLRGGTNTEIFVFDGENGDLADPDIVRVTSNSRVDQAPRIDGNQIVWEGQIGTTHEIFLYNIDSGSTTQVTTNSVEDRYPQISGNEVVWQSFTGSNWEILNYNTVAQSTPENISKNTYYDEIPQIAGNQVVWRAFTGWTWEVYHYDLQTEVLTNVSNSDGYDFNPQVSDVMVVWRANVDGNFEILAAERNEPEVLETITLRIIGDRDFEDDEYFYLNFEAVEIDTVRLESDRTVINILNDDGALDFGDAPSPYPTLLVDNGARHLVVAGVYLGSKIDAETNGKPNAEANGDDVSVTDDEDGVVIPASLAQGTTVGLTVTASTLGFLDAWMDFNADGDWDDAGEHIFAGQMLTPGDNALNVNVPSTAKIGSSYARFRFSSAGGLGYTGQASDGEVEDYRVQFVAKPLVSNHVVTLSGTDGNDLFEFYAGTTLVVELNGSRMEFPAYVAGNPNSVHTILFDGGKGTDTVLFHGSTQSESVELWTNRGVFKGPEGTYGSPHNPYRYLVDTTNVEWIEADAGGGDDAAVLHDSLADDVFTARPGYAEIKAATAVDAPLVATGYNHVQAISGAGSDQAHLTGTSGDDQFVGNPNTSELTNSDGTSFRADAFDNVIVAGQGYATIGDKAWITGSANDDQLTSYPAQSVMNASDYRLEVNAFRYVTAYAGAGGTDRANLFDSSSAETLTARPEYVKLRNNSGAFEVTAYAFRYTATTATAGGNDVANFFDSPGADTFEATPTYAKLYGDTFYNRADYFRQVTADGHGGGEGADNDVVRLYDSTGNDIVIAGNNSMQLIGAGFQIRADYFQHLVAFASKGYDQARLYGTNGTDTFLGTTSYGKMTTLEESRSLRAYGFDKVQAWGLGGNDVAYLHDSPLGDLLVTGTTAPDTDKAWAQLSNDDIDFLVWVTNFESVRAYSNSSGDRKDLDPNVTDFVLITEGTWEDL